MDRQFRTRLIILTSLSVLVLASNLYYFLVKIGGFVLMLEGLCQVILIVTLIILTIKMIWGLITRKEWRNKYNYATLLTIPLVIILSGFESFSADEDTLQSKVKIRACYEGTMNTSRLFLRENNSFEDFNIGFFAHVNYVSGTWSMNGDTLRLTFNKDEKHNLLSGKLIIKDGLIYKIQADTINPTFYYIGHCKGLN